MYEFENEGRVALLCDFPRCTVNLRAIQFRQLSSKGYCPRPGYSQKRCRSERVCNPRNLVERLSWTMLAEIHPGCHFRIRPLAPGKG